MRKINNLKKSIGNTPLVEIKYRYKEQIKTAYFKAEWFNLTGSIKDRVAINIIEEGYKNKTLIRGQEIVEVTSGNMGISLAAIGGYLGHKVTIFMPKFMSQERKSILKLYGANLIETNSFKESFEMSKIYGKENNGFLANQFENLSNLNAHRNSTAKEIIKQTNKKINGFVAGVGTSGTLSGIGYVLKKKLNVKVFALEPAESQILSFGKTQGNHKIQGLSDDIIPELFDRKLIDDIISVSSLDAISMSQKLAKCLGLGVGISSGANFLGCVLTGLDNMVSVFPDDNKKYMSTELATPFSTPLVDSIELLSLEMLN